MIKHASFINAINSTYSRNIEHGELISIGIKPKSPNPH